jgi:hypothetical protein
MFVRDGLMSASKSRQLPSEHFGVTEPRGRAGFDNFDRALKRVVDDPATMHIQGMYRGQPAILNYNSDSGLCVIQSPDGKFVSGFELSPAQIANVLNRGILVVGTDVIL